MKRLLPEEIAIGVVLCLMVVMVVVQVVSRYVLHTSLSYTEEIVRYLFVWITFLGAAASIHHRRHLSVASSMVRLPAIVAKVISIVKFTGVLVFCVLLVFYGVRIVMLQVATKQTTAALGLPMWLIGLAVPICALLCILRLFTGTFSHGRGE